MKKTVRACVDRQEGDLLVLVPDEGNAYIHLLRAEYSLPVGSVVALTMEGDTVIDALLLPEETEARRQSNKSRLSALFAKGKKPTK